jgi:hypothetical protein
MLVVTAAVVSLAVIPVNARIVTYDRSVVARTIKANEAKTRYCYERELLVKPNLSGTVTAEFTIVAATGAVKYATATGVDPTVAKCIVDVISNLTFPVQPSARDTIRFSYPFLFGVKSP